MIASVLRIPETTRLERGFVPVWIMERLRCLSIETCRADLDRAGIIHDLILIHDSF